MFIRSFSSSFWDWVRLWPLADPTHLAVGSNWSAIDPREVYGLTSAFSTDWQARLGGQANRVTSGQVLREKRGMGAGEHVSSPHVMCMCQSRPFFFFSVPPFLFWCCLVWFPVVQFCLSQRCMTETHGWSPVSSLEQALSCILYVNNMLFLSNSIYHLFPFQLSNNEVIDGLIIVLLFRFLHISVVGVFKIINININC